MIVNHDFTVFILTHGRPDNIKTLTSLKRCGYTGPIYFVVDDEDKTLDKYKSNFGDKVKIFNKKEYADMIDEGNNFDHRQSITCARNACFDIAKELKITYFLELDDDYSAFDFRIIEDSNKGIIRPIKNVDILFNNILKYFKSSPFTSIAMAQGGDFIGGTKQENFNRLTYRRKCMNTFFCSTERPFQFIGIFNEDVNTYTVLGSRGAIFLTIPWASITQAPTQSQKSGISDLYIKYGTYVKAFTTVIMIPSAVKVGILQSTFSRLHHMISWPNTVPKIVSQKYKKELI
jgi:hypothetical protein